jgi:hypothetical protein
MKQIKKYLLAGIIILWMGNVSAESKITFFNNTPYDVDIKVDLEGSDSSSSSEENFPLTPSITPHAQPNYTKTITISRLDQDIHKLFATISKTNTNTGIVKTLYGDYWPTTVMPKNRSADVWPSGHYREGPTPKEFSLVLVTPDQDRHKSEAAIKELGEKIKTSDEPVIQWVEGWKHTSPNRKR